MRDIFRGQHRQALDGLALPLCCSRPRCLLAALSSVVLRIRICLSARVDPLNLSDTNSPLCSKYNPAPQRIITTAIATAMKVDLREDRRGIGAVAIGLSLSVSTGRGRIKGPAGEDDICLSIFAGRARKKRPRRNQTEFCRRPSTQRQS